MVQGGAIQYLLSKGNTGSEGVIETLWCEAGASAHGAFVCSTRTVPVPRAGEH